MGFLTRLGDIGKRVIQIGATIPGPHQAVLAPAAGVITGQEAVRGVGDFRQRRMQRMGPSGPSQTNLIATTQGFDPTRRPTFFPDIPGIPDLGDVEQVLRGQNPFAAGGILPGRNGMAYGDQGLIPQSVVVEPIQKVQNTAPPGYVIVDMPDGSGKKAVLKEVARKLDLWKPRSKPPISASEWKKLKAADRVKKKAKKIATTADWKCVKK